MDLAIIAILVSLASLVLSLGSYIRNEWYESRFRRPFIEVIKTDVRGDDLKCVQIVFKNSGKHPTGEIDILTEIYIISLDQLEYATNSNLVTPFPSGGSFNQGFKCSLSKMYQKSPLIFRTKVSYSDYFFSKKRYDQMFWFTYMSGENNLNNSRQEEIKALEDKIKKKHIKINPDLPGYSEEGIK
jgi:hypothetical protein